MYLFFGFYYKEVRHRCPGGVAVSRAILVCETHQRLWGSLHNIRCPINVIWIINVNLAALRLSPWFVNWRQVVVEALSKQGLGSASEVARIAVSRHDKVGGQGRE